MRTANCVRFLILQINVLLKKGLYKRYDYEKQTTLIRDINEIEKLIKDASTGVICIHLSNDKLMQFACNFVYLDKNTLHIFR
jgi:hypothetical protein